MLLYIPFPITSHFIDPLEQIYTPEIFGVSGYYKKEYFLTW